MESQQIIKLLLAMREKIRAETAASQARMKAMREERMKANMDACMADIKNDRKETTACQDAMEANLEKMEPNPGGNEAAVERWETLNEEGAVHPEGMPKRDDGLPRNDGGTSRRRRADLSGDETCGGTRRSPIGRRRSDASQRTEEAA
jgi:hypothetical protein